MNLTIDMGNTRAKLVVFEGSEPVETVRTSGETLEELPRLVERRPIEKGILSCVSNLTPTAVSVLNALPFPLLRLEPGHTPLPPEVEGMPGLPPNLGADRLAAVVGAMARRGGHPLLIVDAGTCITYEFIDQEGRYLGGNISPGVGLRLHSLHEKTALLPLVQAMGPTPAMGYDTDTAIRSGVREGIRHEIEGYIREFKAKHPSPLVFLTGGDSFDFDATAKNLIFADELLVPRGLNLILEHNT